MPNPNIFLMILFSNTVCLLECLIVCFECQRKKPHKFFAFQNHNKLFPRLFHKNPQFFLKRSQHGFLRPLHLSNRLEFFKRGLLESAGMSPCFCAHRTCWWDLKSFNERNTRNYARHLSQCLGRSPCHRNTPCPWTVFMISIERCLSVKQKYFKKLFK